MGVDNRAPSTTGLWWSAGLRADAEAERGVEAVAGADPGALDAGGSGHPAVAGVPSVAPTRS
jgi:hypothetical protein